MYGFQGKCGEYVEGLEIHPGQIHFPCPKICKGITVSDSEDGVRGLKEFLCEDCNEKEEV